MEYHKNQFTFFLLTYSLLLSSLHHPWWRQFFAEAACIFPDDWSKDFRKNVRPTLHNGLSYFWRSLLIFLSLYFHKIIWIFNFIAKLEFTKDPFIAFQNFMLFISNNICMKIHQIVCNKLPLFELDAIWPLNSLLNLTNQRYWLNNCNFCLLTLSCRLPIVLVFTTPA